MDLDHALENEAVLGMFRAGATSRLPGSKVTGEKKVKVDGKDALEMMIESPQGFLRDTFFFSGKRIYQVMIGGPKEVVAGKEADEFVNSFKFVK